MRSLFVDGQGTIEGRTEKYWSVLMVSVLCSQVAEKLKDKVRILKVDTDENPELSSQLNVRL